MKQEYILCAAIEADDTIWCGHRHHDIIKQLKAYCKDWREIRYRGEYEQGFLTSTGRFVTRHHAAQIALLAHQVKEPHLSRTHGLFTEDLY